MKEELNILKEYLAELNEDPALFAAVPGQPWMGTRSTSIKKTERVRGLLFPKSLKDFLAFTNGLAVYVVDLKTHGKHFHYELNVFGTDEHQALKSGEGEYWFDFHKDDFPGRHFITFCQRYPENAIGFLSTDKEEDPLLYNYAIGEDVDPMEFTLSSYIQKIRLDLEKEVAEFRSGSNVV